MAQITLVERQIDDGLELAEALRQANFKIYAAAWVRREEGDDWRLYFAVPEVDRLGKRDAYGVVQDAIRARPEWVIGLLDVRLVDSSSELGKQLIKSSRPVKPTLCHSFVGEPIEEAYVYPATAP